MSATRRVVGPVGIDVPERLPGGVWGPPPLVFRVAWSVPNGAPMVSFHPGVAPPTPVSMDVPVPSDVAARCAAQGEQPWPQAWVTQIGVAATAASPQPLSAPIEMEYEVTLSVESSTFAMRFGVPWDGATSRLLPLEFGSSQAIEMVAQRVAVRPIGLRAIEPNPAIAGFVADVTITWLIGLASPPQVVEP